MTCSTNQSTALPLNYSFIICITKVTTHWTFICEFLPSNSLHFSSIKYWINIYYNFEQLQKKTHHLYHELTVHRMLEVIILFFYSVRVILSIITDWKSIWGDVKLPLYDPRFLWAQRSRTLAALLPYVPKVPS